MMALKKIRSRLISASAIILMLPADMFNRQDYRSMYVYNEFLANGVDFENTPVIFWVTKADLYRGRYLSEELEEFIPKTPFDSMNSIVFGCCSTLGQNIVFNDGNIVNPETLEPRGFDTALLLSALVKLCLHEKTISTKGRKWYDRGNDRIFGSFRAALEPAHPIAFINGKLIDQSQDGTCVIDQVIKILTTGH